MNTDTARALVSDTLASLLASCDGAVTEDGVGLNKVDQWMRSIDAVTAPTGSVAAAARALAKYTRQGADGDALRAAAAFLTEQAASLVLDHDGRTFFART